jgi:hypothetical protein
MHAVFISLLRVITSFCHRSQVDRSKRYAVCGVCPLSQALGVNTQQLAEVLKRSKSSVNAMLCAIGFVPAVCQTSSLLELECQLDLGADSDLRRWTIRVFRPPQPMASPEAVTDWEQEFSGIAREFDDPWVDFA